MVATKEHQSTVQDWGKELTESQKKLVEAGAKEIAQNNVAVSDAIGIDGPLIQHIYSVGYQMYNTGRFSQAAQVFRLLLFLDGLKLKYLMALGASHHMMKDHKNAADIYLACKNFFPNEPMPYYHAIDCYLQMNMPLVAFIVMTGCIAACGDKPEYKNLKYRVEVMLKGLIETHPELQT